MFYCLVVSTALHHPSPTLYSALSPPHQLSWLSHLSSPLTLIHHPVSLICAVIAANIIHTPCIHFTLHTYSLSLHLSQTHIHMRAHTHTHTHMYIYTYIYVYIYIYIYILLILRRAILYTFSKIKMVHPGFSVVTQYEFTKKVFLQVSSRQRS